MNLPALSGGLGEGGGEGGAPRAAHLQRAPLVRQGWGGSGEGWGGEGGRAGGAAARAACGEQGRDGRRDGLGLEGRRRARARRARELKARATRWALNSTPSLDCCSLLRWTKNRPVSYAKYKALDTAWALRYLLRYYCSIK